MLRATRNSATASWESDLKGLVLDLASGETAPRSSRWFRVDLGHTPDVIADLCSPLPFGDAIADAVLMSWFLHMAPAPGEVLREVRRVLRPGGTLHLSVPLVFPITPEPSDYWRFTGPGVERLVADAGFSSSKVVALGGRWTSAGYLLDPFLRPKRPMRGLAAHACLWLDAWTERRFGDRLAPNPIGYVVRAIS